MAVVRRWLRESDEGAIVIFVAMAMLVLIAMVAFAVNYGVFWTARAQSQNAADSAAMAAAVSWALDVPDADAEDATQALKDQRALYARESAGQVAGRNMVWNKAPGINTSTDVVLPNPPSSTGCPSGSPAVDCVQVTLHMDTAHSNALPMYFPHLLGNTTYPNLTSSATAGVLIAGASDCLAPIALPDKWINYKDDGKVDAWKPDSKFEKYDWDDKKSDVKLRPHPDVYLPPGKDGTGYKFTDSATKKEFSIDDAVIKSKTKDFINDGIKANRYLALDIDRKDGKSSYDGYSASFASCANQIVRIGEFVTSFNDTKGAGVNSYTAAALTSLIALDPNAQYKNGKIINSCAQNNPPCAAAKNGQSPLVLNMPLFDPDNWEDCMVGKITCSSTKDVKVVNIVGFFVDPKTKPDDLKKGKFKGAIMPALGLISSGPPIDSDYAFLRAFGMVR
jgi:Flp pilus assembly protein TadG